MQVNKLDLFSLQVTICICFEMEKDAGGWIVCKYVSKFVSNVARVHVSVKSVVKLYLLNQANSIMLIVASQGQSNQFNVCKSADTANCHF